MQTTQSLSPEQVKNTKLKIYNSQFYQNINTKYLPIAVMQNKPPHKTNSASKNNRDHTQTIELPTIKCPKNNT